MTSKTEQDFLEAARLLDDDNLVWSADLDSIRKQLAVYLRAKASLGSANNPALIGVVERFIALD
jgi:hypothetical protein